MWSNATSKYIAMNRYRTVLHAIHVLTWLRGLASMWGVHATLSVDQWCTVMHIIPRQSVKCVHVGSLYTRSNPESSFGVYCTWIWDGPGAFMETSRKVSSGKSNSQTVKVNTTHFEIHLNAQTIIWIAAAPSRFNSLLQQFSARTECRLPNCTRLFQY